jgi:proline dehydrogenase
MISFDNTDIAFKSKSNGQLNKAYWLFKIISFPLIVKIGKLLMPLSLTLRLPIRGLIKSSIFSQFCGGESINECKSTIEKLGKFNVGTILDYSVEGQHSFEQVEHTVQEIIHTIERGAEDPFIPFAVFKITGVADFSLLEKVSSGNHLTDSEKLEYLQVVSRIKRICKRAYDCNLPIFIDAEESWIQQAIDDLAMEMMKEFNKERVIIYNTLQMYRWDRLAYLKSCLESSEHHNFFYGVKLVRGAYMEKERLRAKKEGYPSPIQADKLATDKDFDLALDFIVENNERFALCAGTHNEDSSIRLTHLMDKFKIDPSNNRFYFAQLLGMSDHISFNLSHAKYNVAKYVPYGPVKEVMPYLLRRADENTSVAGQTGRELSLILREKKRRKLA